MRRYSQDEKIDALKQVDEIGVTKASKELNISVQTLNNWKKKGAVNLTPQGASIEKLHEMMARDESLVKMNRQLQEENAALREANVNLKAMIIAFVEKM